MGQTESTILDRIGGTLPDVDMFDEGEDYRAFGVSRKAWGGEPLIDFINRQGNHQALPNSDVRRISFDPSDSLMIEFSEHVVILRGRRLAEIYQKLLMQRVVFVCEADEPASRLTAKDEPVVNEMIIGNRRDLESVTTING